MVDVRQSLIVDIEAEIDKLNKYGDYKKYEDDSYNFIIDTIDERYRNKEYTDWSIDLWDIRNIMNILEQHEKTLIEVYFEVLNYLQK